MSTRDESREVTVIETDSGAGLKWFVYGALLGAGLGILFAPKSGEETRDELSRRARRMKEDASEKLEALVEEVETRGRAIKGTVEDWAGDVAGELRDGKREIRRTATSARDDLERRLAEARRRRRAAVGADEELEIDLIDDEEDDDLDLDIDGDGGFAAVGDDNNPVG
ncbi:MAG: YtxH domain-containing protein [Gemmatimonadales bacterium]